MTAKPVAGSNTVEWTRWGLASSPQLTASWRGLVRQEGHEGHGEATYIVQVLQVKAWDARTSKGTRWRSLFHQMERLSRM